MRRASAVKASEDKREKTDTDRGADAEQEAKRYLDSLGCTRQPDCQCQLCTLSNEEIVSRVGSADPAPTIHRTHVVRRKPLESPAVVPRPQQLSLFD